MTTLTLGLGWNLISFGHNVNHIVGGDILASDFYSYANGGYSISPKENPELYAHKGYFIRTMQGGDLTFSYNE
jgi:hypothetical protein